MWQVEHSIEINVKKEKIWTFWEDVNNWNKWNIYIEYSNINGIFKNGTYCSFKMKNGKEPLYLNFIIKECIVNEKFIGRLRKMFCNIDLGHEMIEEGNKVIIKHNIKIYGIMTYYYRKKIGEKISGKLHESLKNLVEMAG